MLHYDGSKPYVSLFLTKWAKKNKVILLSCLYAYLISCNLLILSWPSWSWSYGSWIYNFLCNQYLSLLKLWIRIMLMARNTPYNIMWSSLSSLQQVGWFFSEYLWFPSPINWPPRNYWNIVESGVKHHKPNPSKSNFRIVWPFKTFYITEWQR